MYYFLLNIRRNIFIYFLAFLQSSFLIGQISDDEIIYFSHQHGFYTEPFTLGVTTNIPNAQLFYTLDGTHPFISENAFRMGPSFTIEIDPSNTSNRDQAPGFIIRVCVIENGQLVGSVFTQTYLFTNKIIELSRDNILPGSEWLRPGIGYAINYGLDPEVYNNSAYSDKMIDAFLSIPTISLVTDLKSLFNPDSGIYVNSLERGNDWERTTSIELLNPDGSEGFQINCGMRIRGGWSRNYDNPKHAFRFIFRKEYGSGKLNYPLFGDEGANEFDNIDLRTSQNYSWAFDDDSRNTFMRDVFSRDTQRDMEQPYTRSKFYHLFINGTYWGLYQTQERSEASFAESYFGNDKNDYDVIKVATDNNYVIEATDGTLDKWRELWIAGQLGFSDERFFRVQGLNTDGTDNPTFEKLLDIDNLIDYMIITIFTGDFDGPISNFLNNERPNNFYAIYNRINPDGFKFFRHDAEHTLFNFEWGIDRTGPFPAGQNFEYSNPQWIHQRLSENKNYKLKFADRVQKHLFNNGALSYNSNVQRINKRKSEIELAIIAESARWGDSKRSIPFTKVDWENEIKFILNSYLPPRTNVVLLQLMDKGLFALNSAPSFNIHGGIVSKGFGAALSSQSGKIYYTTDGNDPFLLASHSNDSFSKEIIELVTQKKVFFPNSPLNTDWYKSLNYNDISWLETSGGIGYDDKGIYNQYINLNVKQYMHESGSNPNTSCFIRIPFNVSSNDLISSDQLYLDILYDDGFVGYINGEKVIEVNAPDALTWNSNSETFLDTQSYIRFNLTEYLPLLSEGENLFAIHGLNTSLQSSDFLILPKLLLEKQTITGSISPSAELYQSPIIINETTTIKARVLYNDEWGVLSEAKFIIDEDLSALKVTELHYHPFDEIIDQDTISGREYEFIELKNISNKELNLSGATFVDGIDYEFPKGAVIRPGEFIIIASNALEFNRRYGFLPDDEYLGQLDNGGERVTFQNAADKIFFSFRYNDKDPWPEEADGAGYSLVSVRRNPIGNPDNFEYWTLSSSSSGSPGNDDPISEINDDIDFISSDYYLFNNYPNPFNPSTNIRFALPEKTKVNLEIYNVIGQKVVEVFSGELNSGVHEIEFTNVNLSSGIYFYKLKTNKFSEVKKMILLK